MPAERDQYPQKIKALIISSELAPAPGGIGNHAYTLAKALCAEGYDITVLADTPLAAVGPELLREFDAKQSFSIHRIMRREGDNILAIILKRIGKAINLLRQGNFDVCLCSGKFPLWMGKLLRSFFSQTRFIAIAHGTELNLSNKVLRKFTGSSLAGFDGIISVSHYTQGLLPGNLKNYRTIIPNGIYIKDADLVTERAPLRGKPSLLTVGNMSPRKGQHNVIKALPEIIRRFPDVHYHIVGMPSTMNRLTALGKELQVEERLSFHKFLPQDELLRMYAGTDIFIMLSEPQSDGDVEGFGIAILEANLHGTPAIGASGCGIEDAIQHEITGMLVDPHDGQAITRAVAKILGNYEQFAAKASAWAAKHDWSQIALLYDKAIRQVLSKP